MASVMHAWVVKEFLGQELCLEERLILVDQLGDQLTSPGSKSWPKQSKPDFGTGDSAGMVYALLSRA